MHPTLFTIGTFKVPTFGFLLVIAFYVGLLLAQRRAHKYGLTANQVSDAAFWALIAGILGARIVYIALNWRDYASNPSQLLTLQFQGLTSFGGLFFGMIAFAVWCQRAKVPFLTMMDLIAPSFLVSHAIGRVGCFFNGCCFGTECPPGFPLGVQFPGHDHLHHPAQLYDTFFNLVAFGFVLWFANRRPVIGQVFSMFLIVHGIARFTYEFWRAGTAADVAAGRASARYLTGLPITEAQLTSLIMIVAGACLFWIVQRRGHAQQELRIAP